MIDDERQHERRKNEYVVRIDLQVHSVGDAKVTAKLTEILTLLQRQGKTMANEFQDLEQKVQENSDVIDSAVTLLTGIKAKLDAAIAANDPAALQALSAALGADTQHLAEAVLANTPADPAA